MAIGAIAASTALQMGLQEAERRRAARQEAGQNEQFKRGLQEMQNFKYTDPQALADQVAAAEKMAGAATQAGNLAIRSGVQQNIAAAQADPRMAAQAASAVGAGGDAAFNNMMRAVQMTMPYRQRLADTMAQTQRLNEQHQLNVNNLRMQRAAGAAEAARQEKRIAQQEMGNALLTGVSQGIDVRNANQMDKLYRDLYGANKTTEQTTGDTTSPPVGMSNVTDNSQILRAAQGQMPETIMNSLQTSPAGVDPRSVQVTLPEPPSAVQAKLNQLTNYEPASATLGIPTLNAVNPNATPGDPTSGLMDGFPDVRDPYRPAPTAVQPLSSIVPMGELGGDTIRLSDITTSEEGVGPDTDPYNIASLSSVYQGSGPGSVFTGSTEGMVPGGMSGFNSLDPGFQQFSGDTQIGQGATLDDFRSEYRQDQARQNQIQSMLDMYNLARFEEGGGLPMMTPGEPSHETNEQVVVDGNSGAPIAKVMGAETVLSDDQTAQIEKDLKEGDEKGLFRFMKKLFNKPRFKNQRAGNKDYKGRKDMPRPQAPQAPGPGGMADPRMAMMQAMMQGR